ncbi:MAG: response regulator transcription factor [Granulosicoccus sp.]
MCDSTNQKVYVIDDDDAIRDALSMLLDSQGIANSAFATGDEFLRDYDGHEKGCLVLDIRMPGLSGLDIQVELKKRQSVLPVIFITGHGDLPMAVEAMRQGAIDFVRKPFDEDNLISRIQEAFQLESGERSKIERKEDIQRKLDSLTAREHEVLKQVCTGETSKVIGTILGISERTVEVHRSSIMKKMGTGTLAQLVRTCISME